MVLYRRNISRMMNKFRVQHIYFECVLFLIILKEIRHFRLRIYRSVSGAETSYSQDLMKDVFFTNILNLNRRMSIKHRINNKERIFFDLMKKNSKLLLSGNNWHPNLKYKMYLDTICSNRPDIYLLHMRIVSYQNFYMVHIHISFNPC